MLATVGSNLSSMTGGPLYIDMDEDGNTYVAEESEKKAWQRHNAIFGVILTGPSIVSVTLFGRMINNFCKENLDHAILADCQRKAVIKKVLKLASDALHVCPTNSNRERMHFFFLDQCKALNFLRPSLRNSNDLMICLLEAQAHCVESQYLDHRLIFGAILISALGINFFADLRGINNRSIGRINQSVGILTMAYGALAISYDHSSIAGAFFLSGSVLLIKGSISNENSNLCRTTMSKLKVIVNRVEGIARGLVSSLKSLMTLPFTF